MLKKREKKTGGGIVETMDSSNSNQKICAMIPAQMNPLQNDFDNDIDFHQDSFTLAQPTSESDETSDEDFSDIVLAPIIDQLKRLLEQYSDGQIIKELIQNAEDGGATEVKFLYTGKKQEEIKYSKKTWKETPIKIAMQAPALCVYNNGIFTDKDWKGIAAIQCSQKEKEPLKVGRFGLGFKSVFHLTDFPLILSGDKVMVMNPLASVSKVVFSKKLCKIDKDSQRTILKLIGDKFGFSRLCFKDGYQGTLFWFPLRTEPSKLSRDTYTYEKIQDIFHGFKDLAPSILLFLKKIEFIEVFEESENDLIYRVQISAKKEEDIHHIREQRGDFLHQVVELNGKLANEYLFHYMKLSIKCEGKKWLSEETNTKDWIVVNHYHGGSVSDGLQRLIDDEEWSYSPYVSVAGCLSNCDEQFKGHIYCFLPLPLERTSPTGLPVHINGFFALSQDRHHIKWMSSEEENRTGHSENAVEWNKILATEILPMVYSELLTYLTKAGIDTNTIYKLFPKPELITENWKIFIKPLFKQLYEKNIIFTKASGGKWIKPKEATVLVKEEYPDTTLKVIEDVYLLKKTNVACLPDVFVESLKSHGRIEVSDSSCLHSFLINHDDIFELMDINQKMKLLEYFISNDIEKLQDLKILPLANGEFNIFDAEEETVFLCEAESLKLFPGMESRFLLDISQKLIDRFQVKQLMSEHIPELLQECIEINSFRHKEITPQITDWLNVVWKYIHKNEDVFQLSWISHLHLLPFHKENKLIQVDSVSILSSRKNMDTLDPQLSNSLENLGVKIITSLSNTISALVEGKFVQYPTTEESDETSDEDFCEIELPPIIDQLKRLLEQYSDGQIIKAPALCVYNNGIFTDKDWRGIAAIQCSQKEKEPLKVGRFGLGFKSVFHLTDFPLIISGDKVMVMNPLASVSKVVFKRKLCKIDSDSQEAMLKLIGDKFGFSKLCFKDGYQGTLFWFPLRTEPSKLSRDTYTYEKIQDIFRGFKDLAPSILLFLKKIEFIEVFEESENDLIYRVQISVEEGEDLRHIHDQKGNFLHQVEELNGKLANEYLFHYMKLSIKCEGKKWLSEETNTKDWIVVNHYHGGSVSNGLQRLIDDEEWSYSPYVSVA
ncbi:hypothetical protein LOTGIDRAFT_165825 [Lottia gigantea]|uniref:Sacsin/Nov domain-containing protein n=1 Tax=Lottia gigantea TaxID=225164 RepID=V3ZAS7_LOTGI|nr:hypothetical protein LOTGIDRAFT_165825 [Lottia gigantea]ESO88088.1 hypothetical protein LOTGIDRAFT_165825 [Lottia gigantea]